MQHAHVDTGVSAHGAQTEKPAAPLAGLPPALARQALVSALTGIFEAPLAPPRGHAVLHPNGFAKVPVAQSADASKRLFLHAWLRDGEDSHIHNHRWDFSSTVLRGALRNTVVEVGPDGDGPPYTLVQHRPVNGGFRFDRSGGPPVHISSRRTVVHAERVEYAMDAMTLHRVQASYGTMTLVVRGTPWRDWADVLLEAPVESGQRPLVPLTPEEWKRHLRQALEALG
ncbi:hypothetical protein [Streptomyces sp. SCA2-2]|uniref:hypothetical protein n=1 Tax=Streptomyces sp. SCA2-2 TaxID=1563677 RepID=UPI001F5E3084|nr:hypothetical protein [Streptomyces sp. SCA2-2]